MNITIKHQSKKLGGYDLLEHLLPVPVVGALVLAAAVAARPVIAVIVLAGVLGEAAALEARARDLGLEGDVEEPAGLQLAHGALREVGLLAVVLLDVEHLVRVGLGSGLGSGLGLGFLDVEDLV